MKDLLVKQAVKSMTRGNRSHPNNEKPLSAEEQRVLKKVKSRAHLYDTGLSCCCFRIGLDGIIGKLFYTRNIAHLFLGLIPGVGDFIGVILAVLLVKTAMQLDLPKHLVSKMMMNIAIDFAVSKFLIECD